jgi:septum formation protein
VRLLLASASPRRAELLRAAGLPFDIQAADVDERRLAGEAPDAYVRRLATAKAAMVARSHPERVVVGADTAVVVGDDILGKPTDSADAGRMLRVLSGRDHSVLTGLAVWQGARRLEAVDSTAVRFRPLTTDEISWYVASGEPHDKAGAYAIQGLASRFVEHIGGSYSNVVGLPVARLYAMLVELGWFADRPRS